MQYKLCNLCLTRIIHINKLAHKTVIKFLWYLRQYYASPPAYNAPRRYREVDPSELTSFDLLL